jgi:hypothetical protein
LQFREFAEDKQNAILNPPIGVLLNAAVIGLHKTDRYGQMQLAASRLLAERLGRALTEHR